MVASASGLLEGVGTLSNEVSNIFRDEENERATHSDGEANKGEEDDEELHAY